MYRQTAWNSLGFNALSTQCSLLFHYDALRNIPSPPPSTHLVFLIKSILQFFWFISIGHLYSSVTSHTTTTLYIKHHVPHLTPGLISRQDRQFLGRSALFVECFSLDEVPSQKPERDCVWMDLDKSFALDSRQGSHTPGPLERILLASHRRVPHVSGVVRGWFQIHLLVAA